MCVRLQVRVRVCVQVQVQVRVQVRVRVCVQVRVQGRVWVGVQVHVGAHGGWWLTSGVSLRHWPPHFLGQDVMVSSDGRRTWLRVS